MDNVQRIKLLQNAVTHLNRCQDEFRAAKRAFQALGLEPISVDFIEGNETLLNSHGDELKLLADKLQIPTTFEPFNSADIYAGWQSINLWGWKIEILRRRGK